MKNIEHSLSIKSEQILSLVSECSAEEKKILMREIAKDSFHLTLASEKSLAQDWLSKEEDVAWKDL